MVDDRQPAGFFSEDNGNKSAMRLMSFMALLAAILFGLITVVQCGAGEGDGGVTPGVWITLVFLLAAFAPKALQKFAEEKLPALPPIKPGDG
jgi:hypothetical protein